MTFNTPDLCDELGDAVQVAEPVFRDFGSARSFSGEVETLRVFEDNALVRTLLETPGRARVLVVDGGGSIRTALVGGKLAALAAENGWTGIVVYGAVRDLAELRSVSIGIKALAPCPRKSGKTGSGERGVQVGFAGVIMRRGNFIWADEDGLVIAERAPGGSAR
ncbi:MAG: ribonuclease E activity regulator RraA [Gemmatimonadales bacterium]|nr:ribonuclease E activity regulator RraA [Gemmatimonadales bacterium]